VGERHQWFLEESQLVTQGVLKLLVLWHPWRDWPWFTEPHNKFY